ncbi:FASCICLIN-like arabinogalactan-protein 11 [Striga asiatica]|uniref:FASCICLIN-like arabinogalactan-protein 11 n=1 Tax=Striga asiatica TaxID=4170 RepID=A0A5A7R045_STRAF|nr:FASCICLIN-like arabinogalactan-protein 11 [Striga asiatica]
MENRVPTLSVLLIVLFWTCAVAQTPGPAPAGPTNVTKILEKAGQFTTLIRLLRTTQLGPQIDAQLNNTAAGQGITLFAPTDAAFSALPSGTLNSISDQQKVSLIQFHVIPNYLSLPQFQTVSNPIRTQAGDSGFQINVTTSGNQVNVSTGVDDASVGNTVYTDGQLAVYQVDKVLLPISLFGAPAPASAVAPAAAKKSAAAESPVAGGDAAGDSSGAVGGVRGVWGIGLGVVAVVCIL